MKEIVVALTLGLLAGIAGGFFGIGGGIIIVPALVGVLAFDQLKAQGTSLVALLAPVGLLALFEYTRKGHVDYKVGALVALGFFAGGAFGARFSIGLGEEVMKKAFAVLLLTVGVWMLFRK